MPMTIASYGGTTGTILAWWGFAMFVICLVTIWFDLFHLVQAIKVKLGLVEPESVAREIDRLYSSTPTMPDDRKETR